MFLSLVTRFSVLLLRGLTLVQSSEGRRLSPPFQKLPRRSKLPQLACIKNSHHVEVIQSRLELMDNGNHCATIKPLAQDTLDELLGVRVHAGGCVSTQISGRKDRWSTLPACGFVKNHNGRGTQDSPRNAK